MVRVLADRYELGRLLGRGGMARVYEATDRRLGRRVAVKLVLADLASDPVVRARLLREARAAASFAHRNAVTVYDVGEEGGEPFVVMEYVAGPTLADELATRGALPAAEAQRHGAAVLAALAAAHERGLVHRDVKPGNVLLTEEGEAKLADFGIAKGLNEAGADLTSTGQVLGTPRYLAPELLSGEPASPRSDLYAVGVLLYHMLAGRPPFDGDQAVAVALAHQQQPPPPLTEVQPSVPAGLAAVVHRALEKDPAARFPSAVAMLEAVARQDAGAAATVPLSASEPTEVLGSPSADASGGSRSRSPLALLALFAVLALVGFMAVNALGGDTDPGEPVPADDPGDPAPEGPAPEGPEPEPTPEEPEPTPDEPEEPEETEPGEPEPTEPGEDDDPEPEQVAGQRSPAEALGAFAAALARDPEAAGEKGEDLVEDIEEILEETGRKRRSEARKLMDEVDKWMEKGELDQAVGEQALQLLEAVAADRVEASSGRGRDGRGPDGRGPPGQE